MACCKKEQKPANSVQFCKEDIERKITLQVGDAAPNFTLKNSDDTQISLKDFIGKCVILYFYPKDNTPGCTTQACEFAQHYDEFLASDMVVVGISPDSTKTHDQFRTKKSLKQTLLSDEDKEVSKAYGVWQVRKNYGKEYLGIVRTTFIIDKTGKIAKIYKNVKAAMHAQKVLSDLKQ